MAQTTLNAMIVWFSYGFLIIATMIYCIPLLHLPPPRLFPVSHSFGIMAPMGRDGGSRVSPLHTTRA